MLNELLEALTSLTGKSKTELEDQLKTNSSEDGSLDPKNIASVLKAEFGLKLKTVSEAQYKRGQKEKSKYFEDLLKTKSGIKSTAIGEDLVIEAVNAISSSKEGEKVDLSEDEIAKHPITKKLLDERTTKLKSIHDKEIKEYGEKLTTEKQKSLKSKVLTKAQTELLAAKAKLLGDDGQIDPVRWGFVEKMVLAERWAEDESGNIVPVDSEGNQLETKDTFNKISFAQKVASLNPYGFNQIDPTKASPEPGTKQDQQKKTEGKYNHNTAEELQLFINDRSKTKEQRQEAIKEFNEKAALTK